MEFKKTRGRVRRFYEMAKIWDRYGNEIELTDERWNHIITGHPELEDYYKEVLETIKKERKGLLISW